LRSGILGGVDRAELVKAYWEEWRLFQGTREERVAREDARSYEDAGSLVDDEVERGDPSVVELLVALAEAAPTDDDVGLVGAGPIEDLLSTQSGRLRTPEGADLLDAIDTAARRNARFRQALRSAFMGDEVPAVVKDRLAKYRT
jgi:hypothetical protein